MPEFSEGQDSAVTMITGTSKGIGRHLAEHFLSKGHRVVGCSRGPGWNAKNYVHFTVDVTSEGEVIGLFEHVKKDFGRLDHLINNAGVASMNLALLTPMETAREIMNTNFLGTFLFCREAARLMSRRNYGRIVNLVSSAVPLKVEGESIYAASKAAIESFTQIFAKEIAPFKITVNALGPTALRTDLLRGVSDAQIQQMVSRQAIRRNTELRDVSNAVDFFLSPGSDFVTGQILYLGGI